MSLGRCTIAGCTDLACLLDHQCRRGIRCSCNYAWQPPAAFGSWGKKRRLSCETCKVVVKKSNRKYRGKISEVKKQKQIEYEQETLGESDPGRADQEKASNQCIHVIQQKLETYTVQFPDGFMLMIYGTSTGSFTIRHEGKMQLTSRGYQTPPIVDVNGEAIPFGLQGAHGPGGESVYNCGSSKVLSKAVETAAQEYFTPICDAPGSMMPRTWRVIGAGAPKGIGPYHVCIRIMPLPLPHGWRRS